MSQDIGRKLENLVYLYLRKNAKQIFYFAEQGECDFIVMQKGKITKAIQVCYHLNSDNLDRELNGLIEAMQTCNLHEGQIITLNQEDNFLKENMNVKVIPAWKWFLSPLF